MHVRNVAKLLSANVVAQVIGLLVYPILTRMYTPEDFGLMNLFVSIGSVLVILATAEYYYAIVWFVFIGLFYVAISRIQSIFSTEEIKNSQ